MATPVTPGEQRILYVFQEAAASGRRLPFDGKLQVADVRRRLQDAGFPYTSQWVRTQILSLVQKRLLSRDLKSQSGRHLYCLAKAPDVCREEMQHFLLRWAYGDADSLRQAAAAMQDQTGPESTPLTPVLQAVCEAFWTIEGAPAWRTFDDCWGDYVEARKGFGLPPVSKLSTRTSFDRLARDGFLRRTKDEFNRASFCPVLSRSEAQQQAIRDLAVRSFNGDIRACLAVLLDPVNF